MDNVPLEGVAYAEHIGLRTHGPDQCVGEFCSIHNPSDHHMRTFPQLWRGDRGFMQRICPHGVGHPDPDDLDFIAAKYGVHAAYDEGVHGCDGCCSTLNPITR